MGGSSAADKLIASNVANTWTLTGAERGHGRCVRLRELRQPDRGCVERHVQVQPRRSVAGTIDGGAGANALNYTLYGGAVALNQASLTATGTGHSPTSSRSSAARSTGDTLVGAEHDQHLDIAGANAGRVGTLSFSGIENLVGGNGAWIRSTSAARATVSGTINGGGGGDWLYDSAYTTAVTVNLADRDRDWHRRDRQHPECQRQQLREHADGQHPGQHPDRWHSAPTRSTVVPGGASWSATGEMPSTVVRRTTSSSAARRRSTRALAANEAALASILAEWQSADSYTTRIGFIKSGGGLNGSNKLIWKSSVLDDGDTDTLVGGSGMDWFFKDLNDPPPVLDPGEQIN